MTAGNSTFPRFLRDKMKEHRQMADKPLHRDLPERGSLWARE